MDLEPSDIQNLKSSIINIKPLGGLDMTSSGQSQPTIEFHVMPQLGWALGEEIYLQYDFQYESKNGTVLNLRPQHSVGQLGFIESIQIMNYQGVLLDEIIDHASLASVLVSHTLAHDREDKSGETKREGIVSGYCSDYDARTPYVQPNSLPIDPTQPNPNAPAYQRQTINLKLKLSSLLSMSSIVPLQYLQGLKVRILTSPIERWTMLHGDDVDGSVLSQPMSADVTGQYIVRPANSTISIPS